MRKIIVFTALFSITTNINAYSIVDGIRVFYNRTNLTFQKEDMNLTVDLRPFVDGANIVYQYINSSYSDNYYYFLFFARSNWWQGYPDGYIDEFANSELHTIFILKINADFTQYEIMNEYLFLPIFFYYILSDFLAKRGTIFYWSSVRVDRDEDGNRIHVYRMVSVDVSRLEDGFGIDQIDGFEQSESLGNNREYIFHDIFPY